MAHRGRLLEADADAAARGVFDRLFGVAGEAVHLETAHEEQSGYGERASLSTGVDRKANTRGGGALERGHGAPLEPLAQLGDAVGGVVAFAIPVEAAELVRRQAAKVGSGGVNGR